MASVSKAKCPVSKKWTMASGISRVNASAAGRQKERIVLPPRCQEGRLVGEEITLKGRVERDVALVVPKQVELHLVGARAGRA